MLFDNILDEAEAQTQSLIPGPFSFSRMPGTGEKQRLAFFQNRLPAVKDLQTAIAAPVFQVDDDGATVAAMFNAVTHEIPEDAL